MALVTRDSLIESKRIYDGRIISLRKDTLAMPDKTVVAREVVEHNGGVVIACQPEPGQVVLIKQYRYPLDKVLIELPAGRIEPGEDPFVCAKRELTEETGYKASSWQEVSRFYSTPGFCNEVLYLYKATDVTLENKCLDIDEETEVLLLPLEEAWSRCCKGEIADAKTIAGLALLRGLQSG